MADELTEMYCRRSKDFANGSVPKFFEQSMERQAVRLGRDRTADPILLQPEEIFGSAAGPSNI